MRSDATSRLRTIERDLVNTVHAPDRFVDVGVTLHTVVADAHAGTELLRGKPLLRIVGTRSFGGMLDTKAVPPCLVGPSRNPQTWYCSEDQAPVIVHADTDPLGQLVYGSEGAGKTTAASQWLYLRWLEVLGEGREGGIVAPTETRLDLVLREIGKLFPTAWFHYRVGDGIIVMCDGTQLRMMSSYQQSAAQGSRIQGFSWSFVVVDEAQDSVHVHEDIESRGRDAKHGRYKQLRTATAKDSPDWRELRDKLAGAKDDHGAPLWILRTLYGRNSPFIPANFWEAKESSMSAREYRRRVLALDVGPERATYPAWDRAQNLLHVPDSWEDVTTSELRVHGDDMRLLVGSDPGSLFDVSILLKAYRTHRAQIYPWWVAVDEVTTESSTTEAHIAKLLEKVRARWHLNQLDRNGRPVHGGAQMLVRADPAGDADTRTHISVYTQYARAGITIKPASYNRAGDGHGRMPKDAGIDMINTLFCSERGERRLFVARKPDNTPACPRLVAAIEQSERDLAGKAETQRKDKQDVSHWPAALRYALWAIERPRLQPTTAR